MAEAQPRAARVFFRHLAQSIPEDVAGKFIVTVLDTIADSRAEHSADGEDDLLEDFDDEPRSARKEQSDKSAIAEQESAALLEGCALLLGSLSDVLLSAENKSFCKMLARSARAAREAVFSAHGNSSRAGAAVEQVLMFVTVAFPGLFFVISHANMHNITGTFLLHHLKRRKQSVR